MTEPRPDGSRVPGVVGYPEPEDDAKLEEDGTMTRMRRWRVDVFVDEVDETTTRAEARLHTDDDTRLVGHGEARRSPADAGVPEIGDEIAAGRALLRLARTLLHEAEGDVEAVTGEAVRLRE